MIHWIVWLGLLLLSPMVYVGGLVSLGTPFLLIGAYFHCLRAFRGDFRAVLGHSGVLGALYLLCILVSLAWSPMVEPSAIRAAFNVNGFVLFHWTLQQEHLQSDSRRFAFCTFALACAGAAIAVDFLILMASLVLQGRLAEAFADRVTGGVMALQWGGSNTIASALMPGFYAALLLPRASGWFGKSAAATILLAILATVSRNVSICVGASLVLYFFLSGRGTVAIRGLVGFGVVLLFAMSLLDEETYQFIVATRVDTAGGVSINGRTDCWDSAWYSICRNWPAPIGYYGSLSELGFSAHNLVLTDVLEIGVWGAAVHLTLFASISAELWMARLRRRRAGQSTADVNLLLCGLVALLLNLQFEDPQYTQPYIYCSWMFMGLCVSASRLPNDLARHTKRGNDRATEATLSRLKPEISPKPTREARGIADSAEQRVSSRLEAAGGKR